MKRPLPFLLLLVIAGMTSSAGAQVTPEADSWGEPVDGVQLHLALSSSGPPALPGELPTFEVQIRNRGSNAITVDPDRLTHPLIEIDGIWYSQAYAIFGSSAPVVIAGGSQTKVYRVRYVFLRRRAIEDDQIMFFVRTALLVDDAEGSCKPVKRE